MFGERGEFFIQLFVREASLSAIAQFPFAVDESVGLFCARRHIILEETLHPWHLRFYLVENNHLFLMLLHLFDGLIAVGALHLLAPG